MKLLSIETARSLWLFRANDINPRGKHIAKPLMAHLVDKYKFAKYPKPEDMEASKGIEFLDGVYTSLSRGHVDMNFKVYNLGVIAETRSSTDDSDAFLAELSNWISNEFDLLTIEQVSHEKAYVSEVLVSSDKSLSLLNPKLSKICERLNRNVKGHGEMAYQPAGISFWNDRPRQAFPFRFERFEDANFQENRYYSIAALQTDLHLEILNDLESILTG